MSATFTTETRLSEKDAHDIITYAKLYARDFGIMERYAWHYIVSNKGIPNKSVFNTELQIRFGVTKRTANSVIYDMLGRYKALKELKKTESYQYKNKISHLESKIEKLKLTVNVLKIKAADNKLDDKQLARYCKLKKSLFYKKQKLQRYKDRLSQLEKDISENKYSLGFGGRKLFGAQYRLPENGFRSHVGWYNSYARRRDCNIFYLGSKDETSGNQMFQLSLEPDDAYAIKVRKDSKYASDEDKYITGKCRFSYLDDEIRNSIVNRDRPISYRLKIRGRKVYLQAIVQFETHDICATTMCDGAIGLDFNDGHIDMTETDKHGNIVAMKQYKLIYHGTGTKAVNEMRTTIAEIGKYALSKGKSIVKEDLSFIRKKARTSKAEGSPGKKYNRMIHTLDYSRYEDTIKNMATRKYIDMIEVNPAYTSQIGKTKYAGVRKIPVHNAAAYVIARRGQGFKD